MPNKSSVGIMVPKRYGFDKSHHNLLSAQPGTIVPLMVDEVIPNTKVNCKIAVSVTLPPLASDAYMKIAYKVRAFFVPMRILYGGFSSWFVDSEEQYVTYNSVESEQEIINSASRMPCLTVSTATPSSDLQGFMADCGLADYLGARQGAFAAGAVINPLPFVAYHKIWEDWFRNPLVQRSCFAKPLINSGLVSDEYRFAMLPWTVLNNSNYQFPANCDLHLADNVKIWQLRQANWEFDYFTNAQPSPQLGSGMTVSSASNFTISALRAANSLQQFEERNNLAGTKLVDVVKARYGANLADGVAQRSIYLGGASYDVYTKGVDTTTNQTSSISTNPLLNNPGGSYGKAYASGTDFIINGFTANEPGYIFVVGYLSPKATYSAGLRRYLRHYIGGAGSIADMANPILQNTGNQPIYRYEVGTFSTLNDIFGYTDRYGEFMCMENELHGDFRVGGLLESFSLKRNLANATINSSFLEIPTNALQQVQMSSGAIGGRYWVDMHFDYKVAQPLMPYSLPSLQNPAYEHGELVHIHRGGFTF